MVYGLIRYVLRGRGTGLGPITLATCFLAYSVVGTACTWFWLFISESYHEDTFVAPGFSWAGWQRVREGLARAEVEVHLGRPIPAPFKPAFAEDQGAECWVANFSAGYFAALWFKSDRVSRKHFWYSD